jgi:RNA polymerase sigma factor (sigma-70 family)
MSVVEHLWRGRRVRVAGALDQVAINSLDDMAAIYQEYWQLVYRRCLATLHDEEAARDATQDVFVLALDNFEQVQHDIVRALMDLARTISYERMRRPAREVMLADPPRRLNGSDDPTEIAERHRVLDAVWSGLSQVERRYVADKFAGFSFEEIAQRNHRKLGTVSSNLFRAREHARKMRGPTLPALIGAAGWRQLTDLARRTRNAAHSTSTAAAAQPVQSLTISMTLAGLLAGVTPAITGPAPGAGSAALRPSATMPPVHIAAAAVVLGGTAQVGGAGVPPGRRGLAYSPPAAAPSAAPGQMAPTLPFSGPASSETPEDTVIYTAAPSPHYDQDHTILALGYGNTCACNVLLRSTDGGATWTARTGAPDGNQLVLPPDYPRDPSIFVGQSYGAAGTTDWSAGSFDEPFRALPVPAGSIALPAGFDSGDPRVIVSAASGVWSYNTTTQLVQPLMIETKAGVVPALATPLGSLRTGVLAMTSSQAVTPGTLERAVTMPADRMALWACPPPWACHLQATVPVSAGASLSTSPDYATDPVLVAYDSTRAVISRDGGNSFAPVSLPSGTSEVLSLSLGSTGSATSLWLVARHGRGFVLEFSPTVNGAWHQVDQGLPQITGTSGRVIALGAHRAVYLSNRGGFVCTDDDGGHWTPRCPAA